VKNVGVLLTKAPVNMLLKEMFALVIGKHKLHKFLEMHYGELLGMCRNCNSRISCNRSLCSTVARQPP